MQDLESQQAAEDAAAYEQELDEAYAAMDQLYQDLDEAARATENAAGQVSETSEDYEALYHEMLAYYDYLEGMYGQAMAQIQYLQSVAPTLEELQQLENLVEKLDKLPAKSPQSERAVVAIDRTRPGGRRIVPGDHAGTRVAGPVLRRASPR